MAMDNAIEQGVWNAPASAIRTSMFVGGLVAVYSLLGLLAGEFVYATQAVAENFRPNDLINLVLGLPALGLGIFWRRFLAGYLLWAAAFLFFAYNALVAVLSFGFGWQVIVQLIIVLMSAGMAIRLLARSDAISITDRIGGRVAELFTGAVLALFGLAFAGRAIWAVFSPDVVAETIAQTEIALMMTDTVFGLIWAVTGVVLMFRNGYALAGACLIQAGLLFIALDLFLIVEPWFVESPRMAEDLVSSIVMTLIFAIPVGIFIRGITRSARKTGA